MSETEEITKYHYYQIRTQRYKVMSVNNYNRTEAEFSDSETKKCEYQ